MTTTFLRPFRESLLSLRRELAADGLETAAEWDSALDLRDTMGPQMPENRSIFVFCPVALLHATQAGKPAAALAIVTLQSLGKHTLVSLLGQGPSAERASAAILRCARQLPPLRHAA
ncbi:MAG: hypothetical protein JNM66_16365 [Bryobacterales bacterium]|nr:hypothetical protein [Bryobacterales bacterium]